MNNKCSLGLIVAVAIFLFIGGWFGWFAPRAKLVEAAGEGNLAEVQSLIGRGYSINKKSTVKFGWTPLIAAIYHENSNVVHYLIRSGADLNLPDNRGKTPLMWAITLGDRDVAIVEDLIAHGADVFAKDSEGATALSYANSDPPKPKILEVLKAVTLEQEQNRVNE